MRIQLTAKRLQELEACSDGIREFAALFPDGADVKWTLEKQIEILRGPLRRWFSWGWEHGLFPMWNLRSANLSSADLSLADLRSANLGSADLSLADLRSADLRSANLGS